MENKQSVIVTGTKGFIGKNLCNSLVDYDIVEIEEHYLDNPDWITQLENDIKETTPVCFFHVGACSDTLETDVNYMLKSNYLFTKHASDICSRLSIPFIYSSSASIYGSGNSEPSNLYAWSKMLGEDYVLKNNQVALRYFNVYGPGEEHKDKMASIAYQMYVKHSTGKKAYLFPLEPKRDFVYVKDVVNANLHAFKEYKHLTGCFFDVGCGEARKFEDMLNALNVPFSYTSENAIPEGYQFYTCSDRSKWMPGWVSKFSLEQGLENYIKYLNDENLD